MRALTSACSSGTSTVSTGRARATTTSRRAWVRTTGSRCPATGNASRWATRTELTHTSPRIIGTRRPARGIGLATNSSTMTSSVRMATGRSGTPCRSRAMDTGLPSGPRAAAASPASFSGTPRRRRGRGWESISADLRQHPPRARIHHPQGPSTFPDSARSSVSPSTETGSQSPSRARASRGRTNGTELNVGGRRWAAI